MSVASPFTFKFTRLLIESRHGVITFNKIILRVAGLVELYNLVVTAGVKGGMRTSS